MNAKCGKIFLLFVFMSISICCIAQDKGAKKDKGVDITNSVVSARDIIGQLTQYITNNDTVAIKKVLDGLLKEHSRLIINSVSDFFVLQINDFKQFIMQYKQEEDNKDDTIRLYYNKLQTLEKTNALLKDLLTEKQKKELMFAPFGIKQFKNNQKTLGSTFLISKIVVPAALGVGFECAATWNYKQHKNQQAQNLTDHKDYYKKYENYHNAAIWTPIVSFVGMYAINVLCNYYCTRIEVKSQEKNGLINKIEIKPQTFIDLQGNLGIGMSIGLKL